MKTDYDILIVEDEPVVVESAQKILSTEDYRIDAAEDAETALQKLQQNTYKIVLSDLMLPNINGFELLKKVKKDFPGMQTIMITGYATLENAVKSFKLGAFDFIPKPFDFEELLGVVSRAMNFTELFADKKIRDYSSIPTGGNGKTKYYFLGENAWAKFDQDGTMVIGVSDIYPRLIGDIQRIEFPPVNVDLQQGNVCLRITSAKDLVHLVWSPVSGRVIQHNQQVEHNHSLLSSDPIHRGWLVRVIPENIESELENLSVRVN
ncbi:MAG TPA: response regulator [bacterium]